MNILVTGAAGFIGYHLAYRLLKDGNTVIGLDNVNDYYDVNLKRNRLKRLAPFQSFAFLKLDLHDTAGIEAMFRENAFDAVVHLAAQAGVRHSLTHPHSYVESNLTGFVNILEGCRHHRIKHLVFASSSSVYGANVVMPLSVHHNVDHPLSLYAATKKANELMAHTYAHLFGVPCTGLRFFTVYGPWGRPDMALFLFTRAILAGEPIRIFNYGRMRRDFTYIDDIIEGMVRMIPAPPSPNPQWDRESSDPATSYAPYRVYNIGNNRPVELMEYVAAIESCLGKEAQKEFLPLQPGDVPATCADVGDLERDFGFRPSTTIQEGIARFIEWYRAYYSV